MFESHSSFVRACLPDEELAETAKTLQRALGRLDRTADISGVHRKFIEAGLDSCHRRSSDMAGDSIPDCEQA